jgi:hypothetical protein
VDDLLHGLGCAEWLTASALVGDASPVYVRPVLLAPLQTRGIIEIMRRDSRLQGSSNLGVQRYLAKAIAKKSGGVGAVVRAAMKAMRDEKACRG